MTKEHPNMKLYDKHSDICSSLINFGKGVESNLSSNEKNKLFTIAFASFHIFDAMLETIMPETFPDREERSIELANVHLNSLGLKIVPLEENNDSS